MLDKKQIQVIFLFGFRRGCKKQQRQLTVWTMHLAQELLMNVQCSGGSRGFAKHTRALRMRSAVASHWKLTWPTERIIETDPLTTTQEVAEELSVYRSTIIQHSKQIGKVKKLNKWVPHELTKNFKKSSFWNVVFYSVQQQWTISPSNCGMWSKVDFIQQPAMTSSVVGPRRSSKTLPKANLHQKRSWSLFGGLLSVCSTTAFSIPEKPLHLRSMLSRSMRSATLAAGIDQQKGSNSSPGHPLTTCHTTSASKVEQIGLCSFASSAILT